MHPAHLWRGDFVNHMHQHSGSMSHHPMHQRLSVALVICSAALLTACASPRFDAGQTETVLPLQRAWVDGRTVQYVTTDISDAAMARAEGANYAPRLAGALGNTGRTSVLERVYKFPAGEQVNIFQSAPLPAGSANTVDAYSPLWRLVLVRWKTPANGRVLQSEEALLAAEERGDVALESTQVVVNCPITRSADGVALKGVR